MRVALPLLATGWGTLTCVLQSRAGSRAGSLFSNVYADVMHELR